MASLIGTAIREDIDGYYVEGVSLTHGGAGRRKHIWIFAAGLSEVQTTRYLNEGYPCDTAAPVLSLHLLEMIISVRVVYTWNGQPVISH